MLFRLLRCRPSTATSHRFHSTNAKRPMHGPKGVATWSPTPQPIEHYVDTLNPDQHPSLDFIRQQTKRRFPDDEFMLSTAPAGRLLTLLTRMSGARRAVEIGTFTGYSSVCIAVGLSTAADARLVCCDRSESFTLVARQAWQSDPTKLQDRIELRLKPATDSMHELLDDAEWSGCVDLLFIDADKRSLPQYYELGLRLLRPRGLMIIDNAMWSGRVADEAFSDDEETRAIRRVSGQVLQDPRVSDSALLPFADGLHLLVKR